MIDIYILPQKEVRSIPEKRFKGLNPHVDTAFDELNLRSATRLSTVIEIGPKRFNCCFLINRLYDVNWSFGDFWVAVLEGAVSLFIPI